MQSSSICAASNVRCRRCAPAKPCRACKAARPWWSNAPIRWPRSTSPTWCARPAMRSKTRRATATCWVFASASVAAEIHFGLGTQRRQKEFEMPKRGSSLFVLALALTVAVAPTVSAQDLPGGPAHIYVPFAPGGPTDGLARILADLLSTHWGGRSVLVENRPGAGTIGATAALAEAPAGGSTL